MNNEIKEILELFASTDENIMFGDIVELNAKQSHLLLNYITNLQEENQQLKELTKDKSYCENCEFKEEKKIPEKLGECAYVDGEIAYCWSKSEAKLKTRINEIIDYLDYLKNKGE